MTPTFDATVDLLAHHMDAAGIPEDRIEHARKAVEETVRLLPGAGWMDVAYLGSIPDMPACVLERWVTLYLPGHEEAQEGPEWEELRRSITVIVENVLRLVALGVLGPLQRD